ncbi:MAG: hypothetical protein WEF50_10550 [Myxococcota bacterium]
MNLARIRQEIAAAQRQFPTVESHATSEGRPFVLAALQTTLGGVYTLEINFSDLYPNEMPSVYIRKPALATSPHRYREGNICFQHPSTWNPGLHDVKHVMARAAKWLNKYEVWLQTRNWPGAEILH